MPEDSGITTLRITGGRPLKGTVHVRGAKNFVSKCMVASLLTEEDCVLHNVPDIDDVRVVSELIHAIGGSVTHEKDGTLRLSSPSLTPVEPRTLKKIAGRGRIPILFAGPLLARLGTAMVPNLGGCGIGPRPVDFHLQALQTMGAHITDIEGGYLIETEGLHGAKIHFEYPSVGATEQVLLSAVRASGITELTGAAVEPEIIDLIAVLQKMGANISVSTDRTITIIGVEKLHAFEHTALTDRLEVASWACAALVTHGEIMVTGARQLDMMTFLNAYRTIGGAFTITDEGIRFCRGDAPLAPIALETDVHPGFMTDWQQPFVVALTQAHGASVIHETVYEDRFGFTKSLNDMGARIQVFRECLGGRTRCRFGQQNHFHSAVIVGPTPLTAADITVPDLRAGFSYVIAALAAEGTSTIRNIDLIGRGYENFLDKLTALGATIEPL